MLVALGATQSVFQILIALNVAYFSFREIRTPALTRHARAIDRFRKEADTARSVLATIPRPQQFAAGDVPISSWIKADNLGAELRMHESNAERLEHPFAENFELIDRRLRGASLGGALLGFAALMISSVWPTATFGAGWFLLASAIVALPVLASIGYSWTMAEAVARETQRVVDYRGEVVALREIFERDVLPAYRRHMRAEGERPQA